MKVLFSSDLPSQDYLSNCVLHGMRKELGDDFVDYPRQWYMYKSEFGEGKEDLSKIYGRGFTIFATLDDDRAVDRTDVPEKVKSGYFDLIVMVPYWTPKSLISLILEHTPPSKLVWLDGEDKADRVVETFKAMGRYYKREMSKEQSGILPISFGFPAEKIQPFQKKVKIWSTVKPTLSHKYIHETESAYYQDYGEALFGETRKKTGWDCMRHYEIIGAGAIPYWTDVDGCPTLTCQALPKGLISEIKKSVHKNGAANFMSGQYHDVYMDYLTRINKHFIENCTTQVLAKKILSELN